MFRILSYSILAAFYLSLIAKIAVQKVQKLRVIRPKKKDPAPLRRLGIALLVVMVLAPLTVFACTWRRMTVLPHWLRYAGALIGIVGVALMICAVIANFKLKRSGVALDGTPFFTRGVYAWSRNPVFLSFDLVYFGLLLLYFNWASLLAAAILMALLHLQIVWVEEPHLHRTFGEAYYAYQHSVNRYFGKVK